MTTYQYSKVSTLHCIILHSRKWVTMHGFIDLGKGSSCVTFFLRTNNWPHLQKPVVSSPRSVFQQVKTIKLFFWKFSQTFFVFATLHNLVAWSSLVTLLLAFKSFMNMLKAHVPKLIIWEHHCLHSSIVLTVHLSPLSVSSSLSSYGSLTSYLYLFHDYYSRIFGKGPYWKPKYTVSTEPPLSICLMTQKFS